MLDILTISLHINNTIVLISGIYTSHKADITYASDFIYNNCNDFSSKRDLFLVDDFNINILNNNNNNKYFLNSTNLIIIRNIKIFLLQYYLNLNI